MGFRKQDFPIFQKNPELVYADSAASSLKPRKVIDAITDFYQTNGSNVHRGAYRLSEDASQKYESARQTVANFMGADSCEVVFTSGATASINMIAHSFTQQFMVPGDRILVTQAEHHSNWIVWQQLAKLHGYEFVVLPLPFSMSDLEERLDARTKIFCFPYVSNVLGMVFPVEKWSALAYNAGVATLIDASQAVGHMAINFRSINADFMAFSGHKMLGPTGIGVLVGKKKWMEKLQPTNFGGGMVNDVSEEGCILQGSPQKWEAGTPCIAGAIGLEAAILYIQTVTFKLVQEEEQRLYKLCMERLKLILGVRVVCEELPFERKPIFSFVVDGIHAHDVATILDMKNICVRAGHHCAKPLLRALDVSSLVRASWSAFYNVEEDINRLCDGLEECKKVYASV